MRKLEQPPTQGVDTWTDEFPSYVDQKECFDFTPVMSNNMH